MKRTLLCFFSFFQMCFALADNFLIDPISGKSLEHHHTGINMKSDALNPLEEISVFYCVFNGNSFLSGKVKVYVENLLTDSNFIRKFQQHKDNTLVRFMRLNLSMQISRYDQIKIRNQAVSLESIDCDPIYYYNNKVCLQIKAEYKINPWDRRLEKKAAMVYSLFLDAGDGSITTLEKMCPASLRSRFKSALTQARNNAIVNLGLNSNRRFLEDYVDEEMEDPLKPDTILPKAFTSPATLEDLIFDVFSGGFLVSHGAGNTEYSFGSPFTFLLPEDQISMFLPFAKKLQVLGSLQSAACHAVNACFLRYLVKPHVFTQDEHIQQEFERIPKTGLVTVFTRQLGSSDSIFKPLYKFSYNRFHLPDSIFLFESGQEKWFLNFTYNNSGQLIRYLESDLSEVRNDYLLSYWPNGLLHRVKNVVTKEERQYSNQQMNVLERVDKNGEITNKVYTFDSLGNLLTAHPMGKTPTYKAVFHENLRMADGVYDNLYSYTATKQIDSKEMNRGRYLSKYYYNKDDKMIRVVLFDTDLVQTKTIIEYDNEGRVILVSKKDYNNEGRIYEVMIDYRP